MPLHCSIDDLSPLDFVHILVPAGVQIFVYGVYATLFCQCIYLFRKQLNKGHKGILAAVILLFFCCTIQCVLGSINSIPVSAGYFSVTNIILYIVTNLIADSLFTYRCYVIWGHKKSIVCVPLLLILAGTGIGAYNSISALPFGETTFFSAGPDPRAPLFISLATNTILTFLSAGRIWWISRHLKILGPKVSRKYNLVIALIIESGAMYCVAIAAYLISIPKDVTDGLYYYYNISDITAGTFFGILTQIVGIAPTLLAVRIGLGISVEDAQTITLASGIRFDHGDEGSRRPDSTNQPRYLQPVTGKSQR